MPFQSPSTPLLYYNMDMFDKAGITQAPGSLGEIGRIADDLVNKGGAGEPISLSIYGWFFEQFTCKQGLNYRNNGMDVRQLPQQLNLTRTELGQRHWRPGRNCTTRATRPMWAEAATRGWQISAPASRL